jgi:AmmeMemoRadiSam system protein B/AmmeMemoRadiSam system protein A
MSAVRAPAVAGTFYPENTRELASTVDSMLPDSQAAAPKVIIAPHAGYIYSGAIAGHAYSGLKNAATPITRVILLGPSHRVGFKGIAATSSTAYSTPLGKIPVDSAAVQLALQQNGTGFLDEAHTNEHSLEVHLPFLQRVLDTFSLVPLVVGDATTDEVAGVLKVLWGGPETLIVISSDLSHYHPYSEAQQIDAKTSKKILALEPELVGEEACGCRPLNGLLQVLRDKKLTVEEIDVRNSGDTAGDRDRVVGYGAYVVVDSTNSPTINISENQIPLAWRQRLIQVAREAVLCPLSTRQKYQLEPGHYPPAFKVNRASFVTLKLRDQLRGCIGSLVAHQPLVVDVANNAQSAAFKDPRFSPVTLDEYQNIDFHISVLSIPEKLKLSNRKDLIATIRPGVDGLILEENGKKATYLPSVWEQLPTAELFVSELRRKAGLPAEGWNASTLVHRYTTEEFC